MKSVFLKLFLMVNLIFLDQKLKFLIVDRLAGNLEKYSIISNLVDITYIENQGIAFGLLSTLSKKTINILILFIFLILISFFFKRTYSKKSKFLCIIIISGTFSNFLDRMLRGFVVDYIKLSFFPPVFNLADVYIVVGTILLVLEIIFNSHLYKLKKQSCLNIKKSNK